MYSSDIYFGLIIAALYFLVSAGYITLYMTGRASLRIPVRSSAVFAASIHLIYLAILTSHLERLPLASMFEATTVTAFFIAVTYMLIQFTSGAPGTGIFVFPTVLGLQLVSAFNVQPVESFNAVLKSPFFALHILPSIIGYAAFLIALLYSIMYLLLFTQIKSRKFGLIFDRFPSLEILDKLNGKAVFTGFILLTIGIGTGDVWATRVWGDVSIADPKVLISNLLWLIYGISIMLRKFRGWQGKRVAYLQIGGGIVLLISYFII